jgi:peptide/nickel transport system ATP-binding protein
MPDLMLELINLTKTYQVSAGAFRGKRDLRAVNGITLTLEKGEVLGLVGESGCGKTTVAKLVLSLETPTSGHIRLQGRSLTDCDSKEIARQVQPVFQDPYASLNPRKSV